MSNTKKSAHAIRGAIAATTATFVLMGGFGAFALWNSEGLGQAKDAKITAGRLAITSVSADKDHHGWYFNGDAGGTAAGAEAIENIDAFRASPGDTLVFRGAVTLVVEGSDLHAKLSVDRDDLVTVNVKEGDEGSGKSAAMIASELAAGITTTVVMDGEGDIIAGNETGAPQEVEVEIGVAFSPDLTNDLMTESVVVNLANMEFNLDQVGVPAGATSPAGDGAEAGA